MESRNVYQRKVPPNKHLKYAEQSLLDFNYFPFPLPSSSIDQKLAVVVYFEKLFKPIWGHYRISLPTLERFKLCYKYFKKQSHLPRNIVNGYEWMISSARWMGRKNSKILSLHNSCSPGKATLLI